MSPSRRPRDEHIGTAFHVSDNIWVTARHVLEGNEIRETATTVRSIAEYSKLLSAHGGTVDPGLFSLPGGSRLAGRPLLHPDSAVDVAALRLQGPFASSFAGDEPQ